MKKIKSLKKFEKSFERKENELNCFKRIEISEIPLNLGLYPDKLQKSLTNSTTSEIDRAHARILLNPIIQKTLIKLIEFKGVEVIEKFLKRNEKNVKKSTLKKIEKKVEGKIIKAKEEKREKKDSAVNGNEKKAKKSKDYEPGRFVRSLDYQKEDSSNSSDEEECIPKSTDPFFVDVNNGNNYLAAVSTAISDASSEDEQIVREEKKVVRDKKKEVRQQKKPVNMKTKPKMKEKVDNNTEELHPSWIAKQQQKKLQIQEFKGTKIKFDD